MKGVFSPSKVPVDQRQLNLPLTPFPGHCLPRIIRLPPPTKAAWLHTVLNGERICCLCTRGQQGAGWPRRGGTYVISVWLLVMARADDAAVLVKNKAI
jgi:hypothetical protein